MKFHSCSEIFPLIEGAAFDDLVADIKANGLREKIWTYQGEILDGRNRFLACRKAKVDPDYRIYKGKDPLAFVVSLNVQRRHLTEAQRAMAAARIATMRQGTRTDLASREAKSQSHAANELDVSRSSVQRAKKVIDEGSVALQRAVENGDVPLAKAASVVTLPKSEQLGAATKSIEVAPEPDFDFTDYEPENDEEYRASIDKVMMADDKLSAMREELKQVRREMQGLKASRDHYLSEAGAAVRLVKARDRTIDRLKKELGRHEKAAA